MNPLSPNSLRKHRISRPEDFRNLAYKGKRIGVGTLALKWLPSQDGENRLAFVVRKKAGNAPFRNRIRRILRTMFYASMKDFHQPVWAMVQFLGSSKTFSVKEFRTETQQVIQKTGWQA